MSINDLASGYVLKQKMNVSKFSTGSETWSNIMTECFNSIKSYAASHTEQIVLPIFAALTATCNGNTYLNIIDNNSTSLAAVDVGFYNNALLVYRMYFNDTSSLLFQYGNNTFSDISNNVVGYGYSATITVLIFEKPSSAN